MSHAITDRLIQAAQVVAQYRTELKEIDWPAIPPVLKALGFELPLATAVLFDSVADDCRKWPVIRAVLASVADTANRARLHHTVTSDIVPRQASAARIMCAELVGILGGALSLSDMAAWIVSEVENS